VRRSLLVIIPLFLWVLLFGNANVLRDCGVAIPVVLSGFLLIMRELLKGDESPQQQPNSQADKILA
jgi:hypothetical protein